MMNLYNFMPPLTQDILVSLAGWRQRNRRYSPYFFKKLEEYIAHDYISRDEILEIQRHRLSNALEQASRTQFYSRLFSSMGAHWSELCNRQEFQKIPITYKDDVVKNPQAFIPIGATKKPIKFSTSGTTGQPFTFNVSIHADAELWAVWWRYRKRFGIEFGDKCALFSPSPVVPSSEKKRYWRYNHAYNEYRFSVHHISRDSAARYVSSLNKIQAPWIHGTPSSLSYISQLMVEQDLCLKYKPKIITTGSENLLPWQKNVISHAFGLTPVQHYGLMEGVSNISQCPHGALHVDEDFSLTEFVPLHDSELNMIVGTPFHNDAFSLIRYFTGDLALLDDSEGKCSCHLPGRVVTAIDGRLTDHLILPNGTRVASLSRIFHGIVGLAEAQLYQDKSGSVFVRYATSAGWLNSNINLIEKNLRNRVGNDLKITFQKVDSVQRTPQGKVKLIISEYTPHNNQG